MRVTVAQLAERLGAELVGDGSGQISSVGAVEAADESAVTFVTDDKYKAGLEKSSAGAVIVGSKMEGFAGPQLVVENVDKALIDALTIFAPPLKGASEGIDSTAKVADDAQISEGVSVGPGVVIEGGVRIGPSTIIGAGCKIGENSKLGKNCRLDSNVVVYHNCCIGENVIIQANSTIGSIGFGHSYIDGRHQLIPHNGGVVIEDFVEIGANCCVDRAKFGNTIIGAGTKIDNLVQIAHNVEIGKCCLIAGLVGIAGSCRLGDGVVLAGQVGLADNIEIGDGVIVGAQAGVANSVPGGKQIIGSPAIDHKKQFKIFSLMFRLPRLAEQVKQLDARVEKFESAKDNKE